jgi:methyltransferase (TIGR00027 family)
MLPGQPSRTLLSPAVKRAAHQLLDAPHIFDDPIAVGLVREASEQAILATCDDHRRPESTLLRSLFALRSRFAEDRLAEAVARGVRQYVIVGAGLDTFAWRQPEFARGMRIFAVDHVTTLVWTQLRFWERGLPKPANLTFVPADLEEDRLGERLTEFGFEPQVPTFCSVLGVTQYLDRGSVEALLRFAAMLKFQSEIVFSFVASDDELSGDELDLTVRFLARTEAMGEPWKTRLRPQELSKRLAQLGFRDVFHLTPKLAQERYFVGRQDALSAPQWEQLMAAVV